MKNILSFIFTLLLYVYTNSIYTQTQLWVYNTNARGLFEHVTDMQVMSNGDVYICGYIDDNTPDYLIAKFNASGSLLWWKLYDGPEQGKDTATALVVNSSGDVFVTGMCGDINEDFDVVTVKYNTNGVFQWASQPFDGPSLWGVSKEDEAIDIDIDNDGHIYVIGTVPSGYDLFSTDIVTLIYSATGSTSNIYYFNIGNRCDDVAQRMVIDKTNGVLYITYKSDRVYYSFGGSYDAGISTLRYNLYYPTMNLMWVRRYDGPVQDADDIPYDIAINSNGKIIVCGESPGPNTGLDYVMLSYDPNLGEIPKGDEQDFFAVRYNGPGNSHDIPSALICDGSGNTYVTGKSTGSGTNYDYATIKYDFNLSQQWVSRYNSSGNLIDRANDIAIDNQNNVYVTGTINENSGLTQGDYGTIKYNSSGTQQWLATFSYSSANDQGCFIGIGEQNKVYVSGWENRGSDYRIGVVKYSSTSDDDGDGDSQRITRSIDNSITNFPNPFNPVTNIFFSIKHSGHVNIEIYNSIGQKILTLVNEELSAGDHNVEFNANGLPSGIYFYKISTNGYTKTQKMLLIK